MPFTASKIASLKPKTARYEVPEPGRTGLSIRVTPRGVMTWAFRYRHKGKQKRMVLGSYPLMGLAKANAALANAKVKLREGIDPGAEIAEARTTARNAKTVGDVVENFILHYVKKPTDKKPNGLRSASEIERIFNVYVLPSWKDRTFEEIHRGDVMDLLDEVETRGVVMADHVLSALSKMFNWYALRHPKYNTPIVKGMGRADNNERKRKRVLDNDEIKLLWPLWTQSGAFGAMLQIALLTGQRRSKIVKMTWADIDLETGLWTLQTEKGEKSNPGILTLPSMAMDIIRAQPVVKDNPHVFTGRGRTPINGFSKAKRSLDEKVAEASDGEPLPNWTIHDLRRTARSLMAKAHVRSDISERVLGHVISGVEGIYDRYDYADEKADALVTLAAMVGGIVNPPTGNVVNLRG